MYVATVPNRASPPAILLRESYRENGKVLNRTLANLSNWPAEKVQSLRAVLRGDRLVPAGEGGFEIRRSLPHGHVVAALATARQIRLDDLLPRRGTRRHRTLAFGLIIARLPDPAAKLATARMLDAATASHSLGEVLGLGSVTAREIYATLDWLGSEQPFIETTLARRHLKAAALVLYDVTSTYLEGRCCPLAQLGYSRDHRRDRPQLVIGLLCAFDGCPVAVEVFEGNTADPTTVPKQIDKLKQRFTLKRVILVGDRGMITDARIEATLRPAGLDWITALRAPAIQQLAAEGGPLQPSLFDTRDPRLRRGKHGGDHQPGLSRRAAGGLQEPAFGRGARPRARRTAGGNRAGPGPHPEAGAAGEEPAARRCHNRPGGRRCHRQAEGLPPGA